MQTLGCDPEVLLRNARTGEFISSVGLIGGTKDFPMPIGEGCAVQEDNVTVEFNTPPCSTVDDFIRSINYNKEYIKAQAAALGLEMCIKPSAVYADEQLNTEAARTFGCEPDYNAWKDGARNPRPKADNPNLRSAGGHIHIALDPDANILEVVKAMDLFVGCMMLEFDDDKGRRLLYGCPGAYRKKAYGVEYRTASNAWIADDDKIRWVWAQTEKAVAYAASGKGFTEEQGQRIQDCINKSDMGLLEELKKEFGL
jgi:hypothetical protein